jgi:CheY-like chemotaxis protein
MVLVVDDFEDTARAVARLLKLGGLAAAIATDGKSAIDFVRTNPVSAVLLDYMMPGMSGLDVLASIKSDPSIAGTPVIIYSASEEQEAIEEARRLGAVTWLTKGKLSWPQIFSTIKSACELQSPEQ